jgi:hypothetical protein
MKTIALISCASKKRPQAAPAAELYDSTLFRLSLAYAHSLNPDAMHILSAKHHLLDLDDVIEPYDLTLNNMPAVDIRAWAERVRRQLAGRYDLDRDHFIILAGQKYRRYLLPHLTSYDILLEGLRIGEQLQFLKEKTS